MIIRNLKSKKPSSFTLLELVSVIAIVGVLAVGVLIYSKGIISSVKNFKSKFPAYSFVDKTDANMEKMYVIGGAGNTDIFYSTDGISWINANATNIDFLSSQNMVKSFIYNDNAWIFSMNCSTMDIAYSSDLINWIKLQHTASFQPRSNSGLLFYNNKIWMIGGYTCSGARIKDVWNSTDGIEWSQAGSGSYLDREWMTVLVFDNKMWIFGGHRNGVDLNDAWYSTDGVNWTNANATNIPGRSNHSAIVYDNKIWIIGGTTAHSNYRNDVWYSSDGTNWTQATSNADFSPRASHSLVVYDNKMWLIGGNNGVNLNDVWYSSDGINWTEATSSAAFTARKSSGLINY